MAESVTVTSDALRDDVARAADALTLTAAALGELLPPPGQAELTFSEVKTAAQSATIALVLVSTVAVMALMLATYAVTRKG